MDPDAATYIAAVEQADGQALEEKVKIAIDNFVLGCKADGIWDAIKASCILAGARTLNGALKPLKGAAPTNSSFVSGDYNRKTGLVGDGSAKHLSSNYAYPTNLQNNCHISGYYSVAPTIGAGTIGGFGDAIANGSYLSVTIARLYQSSSITFIPSNTTTLGFRGISRSSSSSYLYRRASANETASISSLAVTHQNQAIYARYRGGTTWDAFSNPRLAFYSIGESLDLAKLDGRVTDLINAFGSVIA